MTSEQDSTTEELSDAAVEAVETASAGERLRAAREAKRLELSHIAAETRIPVRHLTSIENGDFDALPSRTYAIGFARTYARSVELNAEEITQAVREELAEGHNRHSAMAGGMEPGDPAKLPSRGLAWFGGFAAFALAVGVIAFASTYFGAGTGPGSLIADSDETAAEGAVADASGSAAEGESATQAAAAPEGQVVFTALEDGVWVRFYEDGGDRLFEDTMESGEQYELPATASEPRINTGRPDAFSITIGGQSVPKLADEPITLGDTPVSADALLARAEIAAVVPSEPQTANN